MNTDQMTPVVRRWLRHTEATPPDARQSASQVMARMPYVRQRGRWLPFPLFRRKAQTPTATDTTEYRPFPGPASNGHAPTVIGRTQTMFSPVKAITAGALIFALSAAFLVAQPFGRLGGSVPGAEQGAAPAAPVQVTATHRGIECGSPDSSVVDGRVVRVSGYTCTVDNEWSDPRLQGTETYHDNWVDYRDFSGLTIGRYVHNIVTGDGAWRMRPQFRIASDSTGLDFFSGTWVLDGEGAYEGLSVVLAKDEDDLEGFIIESDLLPLPPEEGSMN